MSAAKRQLKLGAVTYGVGGPGSPYLWLDEDIPVDASVNINWYIEQARLAEAARFDLIFIVDSQFITADSPPHYLNRLEPLTLLSALAVSTTHLGLVATMTTSYNDPFNLARRLASPRPHQRRTVRLERGHQRRRRRGRRTSAATSTSTTTPATAGAWSSSRSAQGLWDSYEDDAFPRDRATRPSSTRAGSTRSTTRASTSRSPARSTSPAPRRASRSSSRPATPSRAATWARRSARASSPTPPTIEQAQAFYADIKGRAAAKGRDPDHIVIMPGVAVFVGDTDAEAREIERDLQTRDQDFDRALAELGRPFAWHDFRQYDLDAPFPQQALVYAERGFRTSAEKIARLAKDNDFTLRQTVESISAPRPTPFAGVPGHGRRPDPGVVRGPRPRRPQLQRRPPQPVAPLPRGGRPHPPGARHRPHGTTNPPPCAATWASPPRRTATQGQEKQFYPNVSARLSGLHVPSRPRSLPPLSAGSPNRLRRDSRLAVWPTATIDSHLWATPPIQAGRWRVAPRHARTLGTRSHFSPKVGGGGEVVLGGLAEGRHQAAAVVGAGGQHDVARLDAVQRDRGEVGAEAAGGDAGRDDGHGLAGGDELELVLDGLDEGAVGCGAPVGPGVDAPEGVPGRVGQPGQGLVGDVVEGDRFLAGQPVVERAPAAPGARRRGSSRAARRSATAAGSPPRPPGDRAGPRVARSSPGAGSARRRRGAGGAARAPPG